MEQQHQVGIITVDTRLDTGMVSVLNIPEHQQECRTTDEMNNITKRPQMVRRQHEVEYW